MQVQDINYFNDPHRKFGMYSKLTSNHQLFMTCTLDRVSGGTGDSPDPLRLRDKLRVAVEVVFGVLELYNTPSLDENRKHSDVIFVERTASGRSSRSEDPLRIVSNGHITSYKEHSEGLSRHTKPESLHSWPRFD
jgi:hypothetical protein